MGDEAIIRRRIQEAFDHARGAVSSGPGRVMSKEAADAYVRGKLAKIAGASRECARTATQLADAIERGLHGGKDDLREAMDNSLESAKAHSIARAKWIGVFQELFQDAAAMAKCSASGGKA
jgi:RNA-splicing ligase RtcB